MERRPKKEKGMKNTSVANIGDIFKEVRTGLYYKVEERREEMIAIHSVEKTEEGTDTGFAETGRDRCMVPEKTFGYFFRLEEEARETVPEEGEYIIESGVLIHNGERIETGTLVPLRILTGAPGGVVFAARSLTEGKQDLFLYNLRRDDFCKLAEAHDSFELIGLDREENMIVATDSEEVEIPFDKNGEITVKKTAVTQTVYVFDGKYKLFSEKGIPFGSSSRYTYCVDKGDIVLYVNAEDFREETTADGKTVRVANHEKDGERTRVSRFIISKESDVFAEVVYDMCSFPGTVKDIIPVGDEGGNFLFITQEGIVHSNFGHGIRVAKGPEVLETVKEYPIPLSLEFSGRTDTVFVLGNEHYEVCRIRVVKTRDRGYVTTVEKV